MALKRNDDWCRLPLLPGKPAILRAIKYIDGYHWRVDCALQRVCRFDVPEDLFPWLERNANTTFTVLTKTAPEWISRGWSADAPFDIFEAMLWEWVERFYGAIAIYSMYPHFDVKPTAVVTQQRPAEFWQARFEEGRRIRAEREGRHIPQDPCAVNGSCPQCLSEFVPVPHVEAIGRHFGCNQCSGYDEAGKFGGLYYEDPDKRNLQPCQCPRTDCPEWWRTHAANE